MQSLLFNKLGKQKGAKQTVNRYHFCEVNVISILDGLFTVSKLKIDAQKTVGKKNSSFLLITLLFNDVTINFHEKENRRHQMIFFPIKCFCLQFCCCCFWQRIETIVTITKSVHRHTHIYLINIQSN